MKKAGHFFFLLAVSILILPALAAGQESEPYSFVVLADSRGPDRDDRLNEAGLDAVLAKIRELEDPRFLFFVGDMAFGYTSIAGLRSDFDNWSGVVDDHFSPARVYPVFGGHERKAPSSRAQEAWSGFARYFHPVRQSGEPGGEPGMVCRYFRRGFNPARDRTTYGHSVYYCDFGGDRFFVLNNDCIPASHSLTGDSPDEYGCVGHELGCAQLNWVRRHLVGNGKRHNFFFHHEPAFGTAAHDADSYDDRTCRNVPRRVMDHKKAARNDYVRLLGYHGATAIFSGHEHQFTWRSIHHGFLDTRLNNPARDFKSLAILIRAAPVGQSAGPAVAYSHDGDPLQAPELRLWWTAASGPPDWTGRIGASRDDAEEFEGGGGGVYLDSGDLELMRDEARGEQRWVGLRWSWKRFPVPAGETIRRAVIRFTAKQNSGPGPTVTIRGEATPFAPPFSQCRRDLNLRPRTSPPVQWTIGPWRRGRHYSTPNLARIFRSLIDDHGFGVRFRGTIPEIKTGSAGAPWRSTSCRKFMRRLHWQTIDLGDHTGAGVPYHYAVVTVDGPEVAIAVKAWDGTVLAPVP